MTDYAPSAFTLFSSLNKSKLEGKTDQYWSKAEWPIEQIDALHAWAHGDMAEQTINQKGEACVVVSQKLLPKTSAAGNSYYLSVIGDPPRPLQAEDLF